MKAIVNRSVVAFVGATAVLAAAFGAHGLETIANPNQVRWWAIACVMQLVTAPALLALTVHRPSWNSPTGAKRPQGSWAATLLLAGLVLFCGTLYAMALGAPRIFGAVTPIGGLLMVVGWGRVAFEVGR